MVIKFQTAVTFDAECHGHTKNVGLTTKVFISMQLTLIAVGGHCMKPSQAVQDKILLQKDQCVGWC